MLANMSRTSKKSVTGVKKNSKKKANKKVNNQARSKVNTSVPQSTSKHASEPAPTKHSWKLKQKRKRKLPSNSIESADTKKLKIEGETAPTKHSWKLKRKLPSNSIELADTKKLIIEDRPEKRKKEKIKKCSETQQIVNCQTKTNTEGEPVQTKKKKKRKRDAKVSPIEETVIIKSFTDERIQSFRNSHKENTETLHRTFVDNQQNGSGSKKKWQEPKSLRDRMMTQLRASRFRFLNEQLYNSESLKSKKYFNEDPEAFAAYHEGYKQQVEQWPLNPLDIIITSIKKMPKEHIIADFGCGDARLAASVPNKVHSFDLVALNNKVKTCDMAHTPLLTNGVNVVVFCLSLMGTNLGDYLIEANRVLQKNGILKIAEVESRFDNPDHFRKLLVEYGFVNTWSDLSHNLFYFMDFKKESDIDSKKRKKLPNITLKTCLYKKR